MGPVYTPSLLDKPSSQDVQHIHSKWEAFERLLSDNSKTRDSGSDANLHGSHGAASTIINHGQIGKMPFPQGWEEGPPTSGDIGTRSFREVHPHNDPQAKLCFYYRGLPASDGAGKNFKEILDKPPHILTKNEIMEILLQTAIYCGVPAAIESFRVAREVFREDGI